MAEATTLVLEPADTERLANLCGQFDQHLKQIESRLGDYLHLVYAMTTTWESIGVLAQAATVFRW